MNATHQFALIHVNKKLNITNIEIQPTVTLTKAQRDKVLAAACPQYFDFERVASRPENTHCVTGIVVYKGEEQNAVLSWKDSPVEQSEAADFYTSLPLGSVIAALKSEKLKNKFLKSAFGV